MTRRSPAAITVTVKRTRNGSDGEVVFRSERNGGSEVCVQVPCAEARITDIKSHLPEDMKDFYDAVDLKGVTLTCPEQKTARERLKRLAYGWLHDLVRDGDGAQIVALRLRKFLRPLLPEPSAKGTAPLVELKAQTRDPLAWSIPLELLPLPGFSKDPMKCFLGFRAAVVRSREESHLDDHSSSPVETQPFVYRPYKKEEYAGIASQLAYFRKFSRELGVKSQWPGANVTSDDDGVLGLARHLSKHLNPKARSRHGEVPQRILHFCCHYSRSPKINEFDTRDLMLHFDEYVNVQVRKVSRAIAAKYSSYPSSALVFLNACQSASQTDRDRGMLRLLFEWGFQHVIGGETVLPDEVAGTFACHFYDAWRSGMPLAQAMLQARLCLLKDGNPAGLLYTVYGDPDLRLRRLETSAAT
jgi:CHAT domain